MRPTLALPLVVALLVAGCNSPDDVSGPQPGDTYATDVRTDPARMRAVPNQVTPGSAIEAAFPQGSTRGLGFVLERATDDGWAWWFAISSDTDAPDMVHTFTAEEFVARHVEWTSGPAFDSTDPHLIPVPDDAEPGVWRVCTVPDTPELCAQFEIAGDEPRPRHGASGSSGHPPSPWVRATARPIPSAAAHRSPSPATMTVVPVWTRSAAARWTAS